MTFVTSRFRSTGLTLTEDKAKQLSQSLHPGSVVEICCMDSTDLRMLITQVASYHIEIARGVLCPTYCSGKIESGQIPEPTTLARPLFRIGVERIFGTDTMLSPNETLASRFGIGEMFTQLARELQAVRCLNCRGRDTIGSFEQYIHRNLPASGRLIAVLPWSSAWIDIWESFTLAGLLEIYGAARVLLNGQLLGGRELELFLPRALSSFEANRLGIVVDSVSLPLTAETNFSFMRTLLALLSQRNSVELYQVHSPSDLRRINTLHSERICLSCGNSALAANTALSFEGRSVEDLLQGTVQQLRDEVSRESMPKAKILFNILNLLDDCGFGHYQLKVALDSFSPGELTRLCLAEFYNSPIEQVILWLDYSFAVLHASEQKELLSKVLARSEQHEISTLLSVVEDTDGRSIDSSGATTQLPTISKSAVTFATGVGEVPIYPNQLNLITGRSGVGKSCLLRELETRGTSDSWSKAQHIAAPLAELSPTLSLAGMLGFSNKIAKAFLGQRDVQLAGFGMDDFHLDRSRYRCASCCGSGLNISSCFGAFALTPSVCPECDGVAWSAQLLSYMLRGRSIEQLRDVKLSDISELFPIDRTLSELAELVISFGIGDLLIGQPLSTLGYSELSLLHLTQLLWERRSLKRREPKLLLIEDHVSAIPSSLYQAISAALQPLLSSGDTIVMVGAPQFESWAYSVIELSELGSYQNESRRGRVAHTKITVVGEKHEARSH